MKISNSHRHFIKDRNVKTRKSAFDENIKFEQILKLADLQIKFMERRIEELENYNKLEQLENKKCIEEQENRIRIQDKHLARLQMVNNNLLNDNNTLLNDNNALLESFMKFEAKTSKK